MLVPPDAQTGAQPTFKEGANECLIGDEPTDFSPGTAPTRLPRVSLALNAVDRRVAAIEHNMATEVLLRPLPAALLAGPSGATVLRHLHAYAAAQGTSCSNDG
jgi:hypothetical protein